MTATELVVLPDCPAGAALAADLPSVHRIDHASGRPWVLGDWPEGEARVIEAGTRRLVVLGRTRMDEAATTAALSRMRSLHDVNKIASRLPGLFHLTASIDGRTRVQGSLAGVRQIFTAVAGGVTVAASGVAPLLRLVGEDLDEAVLAARLLTPCGAPWPVAQRPVRRGIFPLATGHWLQLDADGQARQARWWELPEASLSLTEGAEALRGALLEAIAVRADPGGTISADLSGGLDSTSICFLADAAGAELVTYHATPRDRANEDTAWARKAAALLPAARHHTLPADRDESLFDVRYTAGRAHIAPEGPTTWASGLAHFEDLAQRATGEGSSLHLTGFGGDELFGRMPACAWSLARTRPIQGLRLVNRYRLANRWSWGATVRALADRSTFAQNLVAVAARIGAPPPPLSEPDLGWVAAHRMPAWATPGAVAVVRDLLTAAAAATPEPLDADRTRHQVLTSLVFEGTMIRQLNTAFAGTGIAWDAPFLDDRVLEAALATRVDQRLASGRFKPLLTEAVRDVVPEDILGRRDKGEFSAEMFEGLERNRAGLLELCDDAHVARLGLVDQAAFRSALLNPGPMSEHLQPIATTVACESWLRTHLAPHPEPHPPPHLQSHRQPHLHDVGERT